MASSQGIEQLQAFNHKVTQHHCLGGLLSSRKTWAEGDKGHGYCNLENCNKNVYTMANTERLYIVSETNLKSSP